MLATDGRSIWILDDLTPVRTWSEPIAAKPLHLFPARPVVAWQRRGGTGELNAGDDPPNGATLSYYLNEKSKSPLKLEIVDPRGAVVRTFSSVARPFDDRSEYDSPPEPELSIGAGIQRITWDLGIEGARRIKGARIDTGDPGAMLEAPPGTYTARMTLDGTVETTQIVVRPDPRVTVPDADRAAQVAFVGELRDALNRMTDGVHQLRDIRDQLKTRNQALESNAATKDLVAQSAGLMVKLDSLEAQIHNPKATVIYDILAFKGGTKLYSRLTPIYTWAIESPGAPTQGMQEVFADQRKELDGHLAVLRRLIDTDLAAINALAAKLGVNHIVVSAPKLVP